MPAIEPNWSAGWGPEMMCLAHRCPHRWSVNTDDRHKLCEFHAWRPEWEWPAITEEQWALKAAAQGQLKPRVAPMSDHQKRAALESFLAVAKAWEFEPKDGKAWARKLKARHESGEPLNPNQIRCYQAALGTPLSPGESDRIGRDGVLVDTPVDSAAEAT